MTGTLSGFQFRLSNAKCEWQFSLTSQASAENAIGVTCFQLYIYNCPLLCCAQTAHRIWVGGEFSAAVSFHLPLEQVCDI